MDIKMGFLKIAPSYYTGGHEPATELHFLANKKAFAGLSPANEAISATAIPEFNSLRTVQELEQ